MKKKIARALRRLAGKFERPEPTPVFYQPDYHAIAVEKQTEAIRDVAAVLERRAGIEEAFRGLCVGVLGPQIVRSVNDTRGMGTSDSEILDTLVERLGDGWF